MNFNVILRLGVMLSGACLAGGLAADTLKVRMIAVVAPQPGLSWPLPKGFPAVPGGVERCLPTVSGGATRWTVSSVASPARATVGMSLGTTLGEPWVRPGRDVVVLVEGLVAPRCDGEWVADGEAGAAQDGKSRAALMTEVRSAEASVRAAHPGADIHWAGLVLLNGSAETAEEKNSQDFGGNFALALTDWRAELGKRVPIVWTRLPEALPEWDEARSRRWNRVRDMQAELAGAHPMTKCLETNDLPRGPGSVELTPEGWLKLGERTGIALQALISEVETCCPTTE